jgi:PPOX class probable F420-dependent enzyme
MPMAAATLSEAPDWAQALLDEQPVGHLGLLDERGRPRVQPVTFARVGEALWSAVDDKPKRRPGERLARVRRLRAEPACALTVDRYDDDWTHLAWIQVVANATVLDMREDVLAALAARYPAYRERPPRGPLLRLEPVRVLWWSG